MSVQQAIQHGEWWAQHSKRVTLASALAKCAELRDAYGEPVADAFLDGIRARFPSLHAGRIA